MFNTPTKTARTFPFPSRECSHSGRFTRGFLPFHCKFNQRRNMRLFCTVLAYALVPLGALAYPLDGNLVALAQGSTIPNDDDPTAHAGMNPLGSPVSDTGVQSFSMTGSGITTTGNLREVVWRNPSGTLDFYMQFDVLSGALSSVFAADTGNFGGFLTSAGTVSTIALLGAPGSQFPTSISRSPGDGDTLTFIFTKPITSGLSATMVVSTNALLDHASNIGLIGGGGGTQTLGGFQPMQAIPEPRTVGLFAAGVGLILMGRRRRS
jgi:hypothetical protein